jgi:hypothetical protein
MPYLSHCLSVACVVALSAQPAHAQVRNSTTPPAAVDFGDYGFPGLLKALYFDDFRRVNDEPRVRAYYVGMSKAFTEACGEPAPALTLQMMRFGFPEIRQMQRNPMAGLKDALERLMGRPDRGTGYTGPRVALEGYEDARLFSQRYGCRTPAFLHIHTNLYWHFDGNDQSGPDGLMDDARLIPMMSASYRRENGVSDPPPPAVHWWTPLLGFWRGTIENPNGPQEITLELIDPVDPALRGVLSELKTAGRGPKGDLQINTRTPAIRLSSDKHGLVEFPGFPRTSSNQRIEGTVSADGKSINGFLLWDVPNPAYQKNSLRLTKQ